MGRWWWSGDAERIAQLWETVRRAAKLRKSWQHERADAVHEVLASVGGVDPFWIDGSFIEYVRRALQAVPLGGVAKVARAAGRSREVLWRLRHRRESSPPNFGTCLRILNALKIQLPWLDQQPRITCGPVIGRSKPKQSHLGNNQAVTVPPLPVIFPTPSSRGPGVITSVRREITTFRQGVITATRRVITTAPPGAITTAQRVVTTVPPAGAAPPGSEMHTPSGAEEEAVRGAPEGGYAETVERLAGVIRPELRTAIDEYLAGEMCGPTSEKKSRKRSLRDASTDYTAQASLDHMSAAVGEGDVGAFDKGGDGVAVRMGDVEGFFVSRSRRDEHPSISLHDFTRFQIQLRQEEIREQREWREEQRRRDEQREVREEARRDREREREEKRRAEDREREEKRRTQDREMAAQQVQAYQVLVGTVANTQTQLCGLLGQQNQGKSQFWDQAGQFFMNLAEQFAPEQGDGNNG